MCNTNPLHSSLGNDMVDFYVGKSRTRFTVYKRLICEKIPVFSNFFDGRFAESLTNSVDLPEEEPFVFDQVLKWIFSGRLDYFYGHDEKWRALCSIPDCAEWLYTRIYIFADKYLIEDLQDHAINSIIFSYTNDANCVTKAALIYAYSNTTEGSALRRFLALSVVDKVFHSLEFSGWCSRGSPASSDCHLDRDGLKEIFEEWPEFSVDYHDALVEIGKKHTRKECALGPPDEDDGYVCGISQWKGYCTVSQWPCLPGHVRWGWEEGSEYIAKRVPFHNMDALLEIFCQHHRHDPNVPCTVPNLYAEYEHLGRLKSMVPEAPVAETSAGLPSSESIMQD